MNNNTLLILQIFLGILSSTIAIIGLKTVIVPFIDLKNGCPVWEYIDRDIYEKLIEDEITWQPLKNEIEKFKAINSIAGICLQSETEYLI